MMSMRPTKVQNTSVLGDVKPQQKPIFAKRCKDLPELCDNKTPPVGLWVDIFSPHKSSEIIGNRKAVDQLRHWIGNRSKYKVVLLSGPPGVGKTTAAHILLREAGYTVQEVNASETRTAHDLVDAAAQIGLARRGLDGKRSALILDELDGMYVSDDYPIDPFIQFLKRLPSTAAPIVVICNQRGSPAIRAIRQFAQNIFFNTLDMADLWKICETISSKLGKPLPGTARMHQLIHAARGDARNLIGQLQTYGLESGTTSRKDTFHDIFTATQWALTRQKPGTVIPNATSNFGHDGQITCAMVHENIYHHCFTNKNLDNIANILSDSVYMERLAFPNNHLLTECAVSYLCGSMQRYVRSKFNRKQRVQFTKFFQNLRTVDHGVTNQDRFETLDRSVARDACHFSALRQDKSIKYKPFS